MLASDGPRPSEEHRGYEILYAPGERSWYYRPDADSTRSRLSFRSAFLARRAIDELMDSPPTSTARTRKR